MKPRPSRASPLDRRTLLKVRSKIAGRCTCESCDPGGKWVELRNWLVDEAERASAIEKRRAKKAGKRG